METRAIAVPVEKEIDVGLGLKFSRMGAPLEGVVQLRHDAARLIYEMDAATWARVVAAMSGG